MKLDLLNTFIFSNIILIGQTYAINESIQSPQNQLRTLSKLEINIDTQDYYKSLYKSNGDFLGQHSLKIQLQNIISNKHCYNHQKNESKVLEKNQVCKTDEEAIQFKSYNYKTTRKILFGDVDLLFDKDGQYALSGFYCEERFQNDIQFTQNLQRIGPFQIPDQKIINVEHLWPQSKFKKDKDRFVKKTDMHHLRPAESLVNNKRASRSFAILDSTSQICLRGSELAKSTTKKRGDFFQPSPTIRGDIARSLFYFALMYKKSLHQVGDVSQLIQWHKDDPVSRDEALRNDNIFKYQQNRNPFIDRPELAELIFD